MTPGRSNGREFCCAAIGGGQPQYPREIAMQLGIDAAGRAGVRREHDAIDQRAQDLGSLGLDAVVVEG